MTASDPQPLQTIEDEIREAKLSMLNETIHQATVNLKSAKAVAEWAELRKQQLLKEEN